MFRAMWPRLFPSFRRKPESSARVRWIPAFAGMTTRGCFGGLAAALLFAVAAMAGDTFVPGTEDLPMMPGLIAIEGAGVVFDKPQGRIVEAEAKGKVKREAVRSFYGATLPGLGWKVAGPQRWSRENEALVIDIKGRDGAVTVGFRLSPRQGED
jgi:hypothetical protein